jgi:hypothetical protein
MHFSRKQKVAAALGAGAMAVAGGGVAFAYWTTTGTGTGSATAITSVANSVTINQDTAASPLTGYVLGATKDVWATATNTASYSQNVGNITVTVADSTGTNLGNCASSNWVVTDVADNVGTLGKSGSATVTSASVKVATIQLSDLSTNQDNCKGASPVLTFSAAQGS